MKGTVFWPLRDLLSLYRNLIIILWLPQEKSFRCCLTVWRKYMDFGNGENFMKQDKHIMKFIISMEKYQSRVWSVLNIFLPKIQIQSMSFLYHCLELFLRRFGLLTQWWVPLRIKCNFYYRHPCRFWVFYTYFVCGNPCYHCFFVKLKYTGKSTLMQMWGHFILSIRWRKCRSVVALGTCCVRKSRCIKMRIA